jgi:hypothetical protein
MNAAASDLDPGGHAGLARATGLDARLRAGIGHSRSTSAR